MVLYGGFEIRNMYSDRWGDTVSVTVTYGSTESSTEIEEQQDIKLHDSWTVTLNMLKLMKNIFL